MLIDTLSLKSAQVCLPLLISIYGLKQINNNSIWFLHTCQIVLYLCVCESKGKERNELKQGDWQNIEQCASCMWFKEQEGMRRLTILGNVWICRRDGSDSYHSLHKHTPFPTEAKKGETEINLILSSQSFLLKMLL